MKKLNNSIFALLATGLLGMSACSKDDPTPEVDNEEVGTAMLIWEEVSWQGDTRTGSATEIEGGTVDTVTFDESGLPPVGYHLHLDVGKTYRLTMLANDFAGRPIQQTFAERAEIHQAVMLNSTRTGTPTSLNGVLDYTYGEPDNANVGVTGYVHVLEETGTFPFRYIMRHLNTGVKSGLTAEDWSNPDYQNRMAGSTDIDLIFELHPVEHDHGDDDDHDHDH